MTTLLMILAVVLALAAILGLTLWRLLRPTGSDDLHSASLDEILAPRRGARGIYKPMTRLFAEEDFALVSALARQAGLARQLRRHRVRVLSLYLKQLRGDFQRVYALARVLAPHSQDPDFATKTLLQGLRFGMLFLALRVWCALGWPVPLRIETGGLVTALDTLREAARLSLLASWSATAPETA
jgi:hypothetical protein